MRSIDIINLLAKHYSQVEFPGSFLSFVERQESIGHQIRRVNTGQPLVPFLEDLGVSSSSVSGFLDLNSTVVLRVSFPTLLRSSPTELDSYFADRFSLIFDLQEVVLDSETLTGFNRHGKEHLRTVTRRMLALLRSVAPQSIPNPQAEKEAIVAGYLHDIGNLISRKWHGLYGVYMLTQLFTDFGCDQDTLSSFLRVLEAVLFHEVEFGSRLDSLSSLQPATLSLIIADKTDVSFRRVSHKSNVPEAISDAYILVNLLAADSRIRCREKSFQWEIHFSPKATHNQTILFPTLLKRTERVRVPEDWQKLYREQNIEYVFIFSATFLRLYLPRLLFTVQAIFALNSAIKRFRLVITDDERGISLSRVFTSDDYQEKIGLIGKNLFKHNWEQTNM